MRSAEFVETFAGRPGGYGPVPFWFWNDDLKDESILYMLGEMRDKGIDEFVVHARFGLEVPYLSDIWFERVRFALMAARGMGMRAWIYDEENWPSGYAGGRVLAGRPDLAGKYLRCLPAGEMPPADHEFVAERDGYAYWRGRCHWQISYSDRIYVDMMSAESTDRFIECTHAEYFRRMGDLFGDTILGFFVDEPGFYNACNLYGPRDDEGTLPWTEDFAEEFARRTGRDFWALAPRLWGGGGEERRLFWDTACALYRERFLGKLRAFCESRGVRLIGHLHMEEFLSYHVRTQGDLMEALKDLHIPGTDRIDLNANKLSEKYAASAKVPGGRVLSETFCFSGWDNDLARMRRWVDWQASRGIDMFVLHAFYASIEGERKWECPPALSHQNFYWKHFRMLSDHIRRASFFEAAGVPAPGVAVYYPIETAQALYDPENPGPLDAYDRWLTDALCALTRAQADWHFVHKSAPAPGCRALILPGITHMDEGARREIERYAAGGGALIALGGGNLFPGAVRLEGYAARKAYTYDFDPWKLKSLLPGPAFDLMDRDEAVSVRETALSDGRLYQIMNEAPEDKFLRISLPGPGRAYALDAGTGEVALLDCEPADGGLRVRAAVPGHTSLRVLVTEADIDAKAPKTPKESRTAWLRDWTLRLDGDTFSGPLKPWAELGKGQFSGYGYYTAKFTFASLPGAICRLDLGDVRGTAEVRINGVPAGALVWAPRQLDVTEFVSPGENTVEVNVANTLGNALTGTAFPSGMLGPVQLIQTIYG